MDNASKLSINSETNWRNPFGIALVVYYLVMAVVGMCIPDDILQTHAGARQFSDFMASIVPQIDRLTAINIKPEVNRFYFSVLWAGSPVLFVIVCKTIWSSRNDPKATMWTMPPRRAIGWMAFLILVVIGAQCVYWITDPSNRQLRLLLASTAGRSFWGSAVYVHGTSIFLSMLVLWSFGWIVGYVPERRKKEKNERN